ncbi:hypothetical protein EGI26_18750 [Lacihabitans sp. CCS-44]|nr:hypothetical protein [Lacihabitans sp. CCS-44]
MKLTISILFLLQLLLVVNVSYKSENKLATENMTENTNPITGNKLKIIVREKTFTATILDNTTAKAFLTLLPLKLNMEELNNNEKYAQLPKSVPTNASEPASVQSGDLMMYGSSTLVLFYKSFSTSYSYSKIGKIDDVTGLVSALGRDNVKVSLELEKH